MQLMDNSQFGMMPQYGQQFGGFAGPSGFAGDMGGMGSMMGQMGGGLPQFGQQQRRPGLQGMFGSPGAMSGMAPMFGMAGQMIQQHPGSATGILGGLGIGGLISLLRHHGGM